MIDETEETDIKPYTFKIKECYEEEIIIEATDPNKAFLKLRKIYDYGGVTMESENLVSVGFELVENPDSPFDDDSDLNNI